MVHHAAAVHVVITGIEKVVPTLEDLATLMRLLPRSATGQSISNYFSLLTGVKRPRTPTAPSTSTSCWSTTAARSCSAARSSEMLRCIRCGACMNHCPVYQTIGGHAYGWVYPGPMGSVLTPLLRRHRERHRPAAGRHAVQPVRRRLPGEDPAARPDAQAAREADRARPAPAGASARAVNFISGPSRTGDIEQTIVLGAHGPYRVHLVVVEG
jgi:L-lactate utilization protein LutB